MSWHPHALRVVVVQNSANRTRGASRGTSYERKHVNLRLRLGEGIPTYSNQYHRTVPRQATEQRQSREGQQEERRAMRTWTFCGTGTGRGELVSWGSTVVARKLYSLRTTSEQALAVSEHHHGPEYPANIRAEDAERRRCRSVVATDGGGGRS